MASLIEGDIEARDKGSLIAHESGAATPFGIAGAQSRGVMMVSAKDEIYRDMIIGLHQRPGDLRVNICKVRMRSVRICTSCAQNAATMLTRCARRQCEELSFYRSDAGTMCQIVGLYVFPQTWLCLCIRPPYKESTTYSRAQR